MRRPLAVALAAVMLVVGVAAGAATTARFSDVPEDHWAADAIEWATDNEIMRGRGENGDLFEPNKSVSRAKLAQILYRYDQWHNKYNPDDDMTLAQSDIFFEIMWSIDDEGNEYGTSQGFDETHTLYEIELLVRDLCETLGNTPANATLAETQAVIPDWIEATAWKTATDLDKWRVIAWGQFALCPEYQSIVDVWEDAEWPPLTFD